VSSIWLSVLNRPIDLIKIIQIRYDFINVLNSEQIGRLIIDIRQHSFILLLEGIVWPKNKAD